jgi:pimeloyl-ACP methyl ester carboxylesterase
VVGSLLGGDDDLQIFQQLRTKMFPRGLTPPYRFEIADLSSTMEHAMGCGLYFPTLTTGLGSLTTWAKLMLTSPDKDLLTSIEPTAVAGFEANEHLNESEFSAVFTKVRANLYGIYGGNDGLLSDKQNTEIASIMTPAHFTLVPGASHVVFIDNEDAFMASFTNYAKAMAANATDQR